MDQDKIFEILTQVQKGTITPTSALNQLSLESTQNGFQDLVYAKIDHDRSSRNGFPEVIYCEDKTPTQVSEIFYNLTLKNDRVLATRATNKCYNQVIKYVPQAKFNELSKTIVYQNDSYNTETRHKNYGKIVIVSAGTSDQAVAEEAYETATIMGAPVDRIYDAGVAGIHRLLHYTDKLSKASCIIVVAGMEGALASVVGGLVKVPVIACPTSVGYGANFNGVSALLTMLNSCASGVSVVNINNGFGAGYQGALISQLKNGGEEGND
ncbi:nickel pincer cofactor biosynthesis protein LarB [Natranaerobius trueperi]|uniref:1-(5-phosphoribosyl)-5-amino-4-imidazole-carboxylate carboxylase n=1 Tax=Natranaerobius trueperi TaxID=759412 RepID=A0A226BZW0_9FIRM|nr:nickel pincer cofactor biosynthesis protein LarB [Natranaerobius trueperi]OWZ84588.1 1-(5-phosphoribosyl)-5-amino-4-imidazole-carboxylate carboxylase [Natranaerobius trueperi]